MVGNLLLDIDVSVLMNKTDEELAALCSESGNAASVLISRHFKLISSLAKRYCHNSSDIDDMVSEGMLAFINAAQNYNPEKCDKFVPFACICIRNRLINAFSRNAVDNRNVGFDDTDEVEELTLTSPETMFIESEVLQERLAAAEDVLSKKEWQIMQLFLTGQSYEAIARQAGITVKSVDNAMQRVRKKLRTIWNTQ